MRLGMGPLGTRTTSSITTSSKKKFTLVELMIVVAIVSVLAAIAIPAMVEYQLKSKKSEVLVGADALYDATVAYEAGLDNLPGTSGYQPAFAGMGKKARDWDDGTIPPTFSQLGFVPDGKVYGVYYWGLGCPGPWYSVGTWHVRTLTNLDATGDHYWNMRCVDQTTDPDTRTDVQICNPGPGTVCY